jgi:hypothetical protein
MKRVQPTFVLLFDESLDLPFASTLLASAPLAPVAVSGLSLTRRRHLPITLVTRCREFIGGDCARCCVLCRAMHHYTEKADGPAIGA